MWGKGNNMALQGGTTLVSKGTEVVGDIKFSGELQIEGAVKGNVLAQDQSKATVRVVEGGRIEGEIHAPHVIINGMVKGDVHSAEHIELAAKAQIQGNVHYHLIEMVKGAQVNGSLLYAAAKSAATPITKAAQNGKEVD